MNICVYGSAYNDKDGSMVKAVEELGKQMGKQGHTLVFGGGANGMMGAAARGVKSEGGRIIGIAPRFFNADGVYYDKCDEFIGTDTMRQRKQLLEDKSQAFIITPGGIGTFDEFFEIFTLRSLSRHQKKIAVFNPCGYYEALKAFLDNTVAAGFMKKETLNLVKFFDNPEELLAYLSE